MAEYVPRTPEENRAIALAALAGISFSNYADRSELDYAVAHRCSRIASYVGNPNSIAMRMLDSVRVYAKITGVEFEESSQRYIVSFRAANAEEGSEDEKIRTDRVDASNGEFVKRMVKGGDASKLVGKHAFVYKRNEPMKDAKGRTVRVCPFLEILG